MCVYLPSLVDGLAPSTSGCSLNYGQDRRWIPWCAAFDPMCFCGGGQKSILFAVVKDHQTGFPNVHPSCPLPTFQPFPAPQGRHGRFWSFLGAGDAVESDDAPGGPGRRRQRMVFGELGLPHCLLVSNTLW